MLAVFANNSGPPNYMTTTNPTVGWTSQSGAFMSHFGEGPWGACYSPADGVFVLQTFASDLLVRTFTSADAVTWTQVNSFASSAGLPSKSIAATSTGCLAALWGDPATSGDRVIYSTDAGATWHASSALLATPGFSPLTQPRIVASPTGFWAFNGINSRFSHTVGLSTGLV